MVVSPWGRVVAEAGDEPELLFADLDPDAVTEARNMVPSLAARRRWCEPTAP